MDRMIEFIKWAKVCYDTNPSQQWFSEKDLQFNYSVQHVQSVGINVKEDNDYILLASSYNDNKEYYGVVQIYKPSIIYRQTVNLQDSINNYQTITAINEDVKEVEENVDSIQEQCDKVEEQADNINEEHIEENVNNVNEEPCIVLQTDIFCESPHQDRELQETASTMRDTTRTEEVVQNTNISKVISTCSKQPTLQDFINNTDANFIVTFSIHWFKDPITGGIVKLNPHINEKQFRKDMLVLNIDQLATVYNRPVYIIKALVTFLKTTETTYYTALTSIIDNTTKRVYKFKRHINIHKYLQDRDRLKLAHLKNRYALNDDYYNILQAYIQTVFDNVNKQEDSCADNKIQQSQCETQQQNPNHEEKRGRIKGPHKLNGNIINYFSHLHIDPKEFQRLCEIYTNKQILQYYHKRNIPLQYSHIYELRMIVNRPLKSTNAPLQFLSNVDVEQFCKDYKKLKYVELSSMYNIHLSTLSRVVRILQQRGLLPAKRTGTKKFY